MRETFKSWYPITEAERSEAYHNGHLVLDTSVLLSLYRFRTTARKDVFNLLEKAAGRLWMPHQVGLEFHRNRLKVIDDASHGPGPGLRKAIQDARNKIRDAIQQAASRTRMDKQPLEEAAKAAFDSLEDQVATVEAGGVLTLEAAIGGDSVLDALDGLYRDRIGEPFTEDRLKTERSIGHERAKAQVPPGYEDAAKVADQGADQGAEKGDPLGDYFIWRQVLDKAREDPRPVLFVTQDQKPDWFWKPRWAHGRTIGPRQELVEEMFAEAGVRLHLVTLETFLREAPTYLDTSVREDTVEEAEHLPPSLDVPSGRPDYGTVRRILQAKGWPVRPPIIWHDQTGFIPSRANTVPFKVGPDPNDTEGLITFETGNVSQAGGITRSVSQKIADILRRFSGPIVVVTSSPAPVLLEWPGDQPTKTYHCGWGSFPWLQIITLDDLAVGAYNLPVQGIQEVNE